MQPVLDSISDLLGKANGVESVVLYVFLAVVSVIGIVMIINRVFSSISRLIDTIQATNANLANMINSLSIQGAALNKQVEAIFSVSKATSDAFIGIKDAIRTSQATIEARIETATIRTEKKIDASLESAFNDHREKTKSNVEVQLKEALATTTQAIALSHENLMKQFVPMTASLTSIETKLTAIATLLGEVNQELETIKLSSKPVVEKDTSHAPEI